jgi:L-2,4-diaminobutyric acid acetyltransferase
MDIKLRKPTAKDGMDVFKLIESCPPLDTNSSYCNLLQCSHFADTSILAEHEGSVVGFISGYVQPQASNTLFVWQVAVSAQARGQGLAKRMLQALSNRPELSEVRFIETSITSDNQASWRLFQSFAEANSAQLKESVLFEKEAHFKGSHDTEALVSIGPLHK